MKISTKMSSCAALVTECTSSLNYVVYVSEILCPCCWEEWVVVPRGQVQLRSSLTQCMLTSTDSGTWHGKLWKLARSVEWRRNWSLNGVVGKLSASLSHQRFVIFIRNVNASWKRLLYFVFYMRLGKWFSNALFCCIIKMSLHSWWLPKVLFENFCEIDVICQTDIGDISEVVQDRSEVALF